MTILEVHNLKKIYTTRFGGNQVQALSNVSFSVEPGEYVAIMGESGSGKTTMMNIIGALDVPTGGQYILNGRDVSKMKGDALAEIRNKMIGFIFQQYNLLPKLSVLENVEKK